MPFIGCSEGYKASSAREIRGYNHCLQRTREQSGGKGRHGKEKVPAKAHTFHGCEDSFRIRSVAERSYNTAFPNAHDAHAALNVARHHNRERGVSARGDDRRVVPAMPAKDLHALR